MLLINIGIVINMTTWNSVDECTYINVTIFCVVRHYSLVKVYRRFGGTYRRHLQFRRVSQTSNRQDAGFHDIQVWYDVLKVVTMKEKQIMVSSDPYQVGFLGVVSSADHLLHADFLLDLIFDPEYGGDMFLRNVGGPLPNCNILQHRRLYTLCYLFYSKLYHVTFHSSRILIKPFF
jgi:hypothetical protein